MKGLTPPSWEKQRGIVQKRGGNIELTLIINVKILAKLDPTIILCTRSSRTELERKTEAGSKSSLK
jgi:hypothetical protein